jgi:hypothetical protein
VRAQSVEPIIIDGELPERNAFDSATSHRQRRRRARKSIVSLEPVGVP